MVAERREPRAAAPKSWVQPEPAGKGKAVGAKKRAPAKKRQPPQSSQPVKPVPSSSNAAAVITPVNHVAQSAIATDSAIARLQDGDEFGMQHGQQHHGQQQAYGQYGEDEGEAGGEMSLDNATSATTQVKGGAGPIETETGEQLFCICMGVDNGTPMIFCEACENWFHFECIGLSEEDASRIATYYCDQCQQAGSGKTEWSYDAPSTFDELPSFATEGPPSSPPPPRQSSQPTASTSQLPPLPLPPVMTPSDSGDDVADNAEDGDYFTSKQETTKGGDTSVKQTSRVESDDDDEDYEEGSTSKRKKKESSATVGTSRLPPLSGTGGNQRRKSSSSGAAGNASKRRKRVVEDEEEAEERRKTAASSATQFYGSPARTGPNSTNPLSNPTRKHCIEQLEKILSAIFTSAASTSTEGESSTVSPSKAREYAESIEKELFTHNSELDPKGNPTHSKKYTAKFRTLHFNLKSNEYFRSRVASGQLDAFAIYSMNQEDLLSPEVRAEQEAEKLRSLAQSVKVDAVQPTTKMTHKGEEILDNYDSGAATSNTEPNENSLELHRRGSMGGSVMVDTPYIPNNEGFHSYRERERSMSLAGSPRMQDSPRFGSPSSMPVFTDSPTGRAFSPVENSPHESAANSPAKHADDVENDNFARPTLPHHARSDSQSKVKLDLDAVWSNLKPAQTSASPDKEAVESTPPKEKEEDDMSIGSDDGSGEDKKAQEDKEVEEYDPFATNAGKKGNADDEFDALMGGQEASQERKAESSKSATVASATASSSAKSTDDIVNLPSVWEGQINIPDEGSFPARLVQVGGTPFGPHPSIWDRILPKGKIDISGRIDEKAASEYVVQSNFSPSRENVILAILPHVPQTSPSSTLTPDQAAQLEKAEAAYAKLVKMYSDRKRYGVAPPSGELKKVAKDHYIVPLKTDKGLPDYVELLDSHVLPDKGGRKRDYLLSVLVLQKGLGLNTTHRTKSGGSTPQSSSQDQPASSYSNHLQPPQVNPSQFSPLGQAGYSAPPAFSSNMSPPYQPPVVPMQAQLPGQAAAGPLLDPAALQSLLSNPSLLQALGGGAMPQGSPVPPPTIPQYGAFSPPPPSAFAGGIPGIAGPPQAPPGVQAWGPPQHYGGFAPPPPPGHWNPAGSPPWQGQPQGPPQQWGNGPTHPPGYIDPERIKAASAEARMIAERDRHEKAQRERGGGSGDGSYDYSRGARVGGRGRNDHNDGGRAPRGGRNADAQNGPPGRRPEGGMNQMQAGISDKGWGRKRG